MSKFLKKHLVWIVLAGIVLAVVVLVVASSAWRCVCIGGA